MKLKLQSELDYQLWSVVDRYLSNGPFLEETLWTPLDDEVGILVDHFWDTIINLSREQLYYKLNGDQKNET